MQGHTLTRRTAAPKHVCAGLQARTACRSTAPTLPARATQAVGSSLRHPFQHCRGRRPFSGNNMQTRRAAAAAAGPSSGVGETDVVICGAGIIGAATAYFLTKRGIKPLVIERTAVAAAASGKAGGFLARGWGDGSVTQQLHHQGFDLHARLAEELGISSYRRIPTLQVSAGRSRGGAKPPASWLDGDVARATMMDPGTAQVTPYELTTRLMDEALANGARLQMGAVVGLETEQGGDGASRRVVGVRVRDVDSGVESVVAAGKVLVALGPWSVLAEDWLQEAYAESPELPRLRIPMEGVKSNSVVYRQDHIKQRVAAEPFALFCGEDRNGCHLEVYPRSNGEVYICGIGGSQHKTAANLREGGDCEHQGLVRAIPQRTQAAAASFATLTTLARDADSGTPLAPDLDQACMRPCASDALPLLGEVPGVSGLYLATGHNCWGILWGPVTGLAMSELLGEGKASTVNLAPFTPARFMKKRPAGTRGRHAGTVAVGEQW